MTSSNSNPDRELSLQELKVECANLIREHMTKDAYPHAWFCWDSRGRTIENRPGDGFPIFSFPLEKGLNWIDPKIRRYINISNDSEIYCCTIYDNLKTVEGLKGLLGVLRQTYVAAPAPPAPPAPMPSLVDSKADSKSSNLRQSSLFQTADEDSKKTTTTDIAPKADDKSNQP